ncbi:AAA+ ATPase domain-containing protein [Artemisia annua]|uniref:AAA+ ATPase domain-containing protein n=1 Tax=Artemisia annua TaxID=35608 RepID=A0A2U1NJB3_ARTAN|nr:AAA+ ATPase domain-containing protein [Artemisia annua]
MMTGLHTVADIFCVKCGSIVGWTYGIDYLKYTAPDLIYVHPTIDILTGGKMGGSGDLDNGSKCGILYKPTIVGAGELAAVASLWLGIPVQQLTADERMLLVGLEE